MKDVLVELSGQDPVKLTNVSTVGDCMDEMDVPRTYYALLNGVRVTADTELPESPSRLDLAKNTEGGTPFHL